MYTFGDPTVTQHLQGDMKAIHHRAALLLGLVVAAIALLGAPATAAAQGSGTIRGTVVEAQTRRPLPGAQVTVVGTQRSVPTNEQGAFLLVGLPAGEHRIAVQLIGYGADEQTVTVTAGETANVEFELRTDAIGLEAVVVTALGQTAQQRAIGTAQQTVSGTDIAQAQRENFVTALQGRVAGLEVNTTSGVPGAGAAIMIRGVSSISGSNQPLMIIDGLPVDNSTTHTGVFASTTTFENRGVAFTNRGADFNPEDIESITVLKGAEAAALYGIDAANGAIVITTKRGRAGGGLEYSNSFRVELPGRTPELQKVYGPSSEGSSTYLFWGTPYPEGTTFFNNVDGFFETAFTQKHNIAFSGASDDNRINYRIAASSVQQSGVVPNTNYDRINVTASSQADATSWLRTDASIQYATDDNNQPYNGIDGAFLGLLAWPDTINARDWLTPAGLRRRITSLSAAAEQDNPYFSVNRNRNNSKTTRTNVNVGLTFLPVSWGNIQTRVGVDNYTTERELVRHPESGIPGGANTNGTLDRVNEVARSINVQTLVNFHRYNLTDDIGVSAMVGNQISDRKSTVAALAGSDFLDPNFVSINNTNLRSSKTTIAQRRLVSAFGQLQFDYKNYLYLTATGRNDWTSTIPPGSNSFFYPSLSASFVFSDAFPSVGEFMTGKLRAAWAEVGKDAPPYAYRQALEFKPTSYGGYGYGFTGPNPNLKPEFATSYEIGAELGFFDNRLGLDATYYRKETRDQIVTGIRSSYATGFILLNVNGASTRNEGVELTLRGTPILRSNFAWDVQANFTRARGTVLALPAVLPEYYSSDTWLYGNVRNGTAPGLSTMSLTGRFYERNKNGDILIDPASGLPIRTTSFVDAGFDRQPDFLIGLSNHFEYKRFSLDVLLDIRKGGDIFNATEHYLTARGLSKRTLDRDQPRVIKGVLRDGLENTDNPTPNTIVVIPSVNTSYYLSMSEENFIEKDINWLRLKDVTLTYRLPQGIFGSRHASVYVTGTELFLLTNYSGLDPLTSATSAASGGSGGIGMDYGNFPVPIGINFGFRVGF